MPNPIHEARYVVFREMLTETRLANGMLQSEVADALHKAQSFVSKYERGERRLDFCEFIELAEILKIDVLDFIKSYKHQLKKKP